MTCLPGHEDQSLALYRDFGAVRELVDPDTNPRGRSLLEAASVRHVHARIVFHISSKQAFYFHIFLVTRIYIFSDGFAALTSSGKVRAWPWDKAARFTAKQLLALFEQKKHD